VIENGWHLTAHIPVEAAPHAFDWSQPGSVCTRDGAQGLTPSEQLSHWQNSYFFNELKLRTRRLLNCHEGV
jgi:hypothetical protein